MLRLSQSGYGPVSAKKTFSIKNSKKGLQRLERQARQGEIVAQLTLANIYESDRNIFDIGLAAMWYLQAAQLGSTEAQVRVGEMYLEGSGIRKDPGEAVVWVKKEAATGNPDALSNLAWCHLKGLGVRKDLKPAFRLYSQSATQNHHSSCYNLGYM